MLGSWWEVSEGAVVENHLRFRRSADVGVVFFSLLPFSFGLGCVVFSPNSGVCCCVCITGVCMVIVVLFIKRGASLFRGYPIT